MKRKVISLIFVFVILCVFGTILVIAAAPADNTGFTIDKRVIDTSTNFFTQPNNKEQITYTDEREKVVNELGYKKIAETGNLILYRYDKTMSIALYDKQNQYMWYSTYKDMEQVGDGKDVRYFIDGTEMADVSRIQSGVSIQIFDGNGKSISEIDTSISSDKAKCEVDYEKIDNGFKAHLNFTAYGISFDVLVTISENDLIVDVPYESIEEVTVGKLTPKNYQLKAVSLFPYFGSNNYKINGYAFIPDGSGALVRYQDVKATSAYIKKVYGNDEGILPSKNETNHHIVSDSTISLPIYGINHGYNQAAFLCQITSGDGSAEIHSYPYYYQNTPLNTTFFKLGVRDEFMVTLSSTSMSLINEEPYPNNYSIKYSFLSDSKANYVGMAKEYADCLGLEQEVEEGDIPLHLNILGLDYKKGLFGKNYIEMTTYNDTKNILNELKQCNVAAIQASYIGWNKGGYFNNGAVNAKNAKTLGSKNELKELNDFADENNISIDYVINPLISNTYGYGNETIKRINLSAFDTKLESSLEQEAYYIAPNVLSKTILKKASKYENLGIDGFNIDHLADSFSYRYKTDIYYRTQMIEEIQKEVEKLYDYKISTSNPKAYLYRYLTNYYDAEYESSKFGYVTDSIPFISIMLSGKVNLFTSNINYVSDYNLFILRMVEYNLYPSFIITEEEAYDLRFTNFEYLNSTQYSLWKDLMVEVYKETNKVLKDVKGAEIINHYYLAEGVACVEYSNGKTIYVNYNATKYSGAGISLEPFETTAKGGSNA